MTISRTDREGDDDGGRGADTARVEAILAALGELDGTDVKDHAEVYQRIHDRLAEELNQDQDRSANGAHGSP